MLSRQVKIAYTMGKKSGLLLCGMALFMGSPATLAQEDDTLMQERVVVTGSRIFNPNLNSTSPITTIGEIDLSLSNTVNAEQFLNTLPQTIPSFDSSSNNPGEGEATVNLRGLGSSRTLVLVDGRRYVTSSQTEAVDLNTIPAALVERVDILTGGASAVYGSDAMAGVVNFILKDDYEGVGTDISYEISERGDAGILSLSGVIGGNFADDRGNAVLSIEYTDRDSVLAADRPETAITYVDTGADGGFAQTGSALVPSTAIFPSGLPKISDVNLTTLYNAMGSSGYHPDSGCSDPLARLNTGDDKAKGGGDDYCQPSSPAYLFDLTDIYSATAGSEFHPGSGCSHPGATLNTGADETEGGADDYCQPSSTAFLFNPDGDGIISWIQSGPDTTTYNYAPGNYLQIPQQRFTVFSSLNYDITDYISAYARGTFVSSSTKQLLAPTPILTTLTLNFDNPNLHYSVDENTGALLGTVDENGNPLGDPTKDPLGVLHGLQYQAELDSLNAIIANVDNKYDSEEIAEATDELAALNGRGFLDTDENGVQDVTFDSGHRFVETGGRLSTLISNNFQIDAGFKGDIYDQWFWNVYGSVSESSVAIGQTGNISLSGYEEAVRTGNGNFFEAGALEQEVSDSISVLGQIVGRTRQAVYSMDISGDFGDIVRSPLAETPIGFAAGYEYRNLFLETVGSGLGPDTRGFNQATTIADGYDIHDIFFETLIPIIDNVSVNGVKVIDELVFDAAYRFSRYSTTAGNTHSYAYGGRWKTAYGLTIRAQYQRAVRAPGLTSLFSPLVNGFPNISDPCSSGVNGGWDALTDEQKTTTRALCEANAQANGIDPSFVGTEFQVNSQIEGLFGGNPDLQEETSDTFTVGFVWEPDFLDSLPFVDTLSISMDYYQISIDNAIGAVPSQTLFDLCFVEGVEDGGLCAAENFTRSSSGAITTFVSLNQNSASLTGSGIDFTIDYLYKSENFGTFAVYSTIGWYDTSTFQATDISYIERCVGYYGASCGEPTPEWSANTRFDWSMGPFSARLRWTVISPVQNDQLRDNPDTDLFVKGVGDYHQADITLSYSPLDNIILSFGIENLADNAGDVIIGTNSAPQSNTYPSTYDTIGRTYFLRIGSNF